MPLDLLVQHQYFQPRWKLILPLKYSNGFDTVDDEELSIIQMTEQRNIWNYYYRTEASHINKLYKLMKSYE